MGRKTGKRVIHIIRPTPGMLSLVDVDLANATEGYGGKVTTWAMPDAAFWAWLDHHPDAAPYLAQMEHDNPSRLKRARIFIGVLRSEKACISAAGLTRATLASARPQAGPVLIATAKGSPGA